jgi:hypothetical protein
MESKSESKKKRQYVQPLQQLEEGKNRKKQKKNKTKKNNQSRHLTNNTRDICFRLHAHSLSSGQRQVVEELQ